ncbi:hypothetical protein Lfu02_56390 [Longispora fulva]|uniref:AlgX/AlgJ SGNH hydrolase-like domain-containing protein n=1 Tax=Longispora fulva TaxID=619741 RepID=A0A8J7GEQ9_9ACTN|nr:hypothetical protein [Longispora fulva]MBG6137379.1 hypothetical protein [Longispora fulva]GIG61267.1 hypothetical protein Lfu02_56390 [Longispora fulva]
MTIRDISTEQEHATPDLPTGGRVRRRWPVGRIAVGLVALLFFGGPALAGAAGERSGNIENRALAPRPSISDGWEFFPELNKWAIDRLPLRDRAVRANDEVSEAVFDELPASAGGKPPVMMGKDGRLFLADDFGYACRGNEHMADVGANVARLGRLIVRAGATLTTFVAPDKTSIETEQLPGRYPSDTCGNAGKLALRQKLASTPPQGYVDLYAPIEDVRREHGTAYLRYDTHWNDYGRIQFAKVYAGHLDPALLNGVRTEVGSPQPVLGDLNLLRGRQEKTPIERASLVRPGVTTVAGVQTVENTALDVSVSRSTGAPLHPGRTVMIGDSFLHSATPALQPFFSELVIVAPTFRKIDAANLGRLLLTADTVAFEQVERYYYGADAGILSTEYLDEVERAIDAGLAGR